MQPVKMGKILVTGANGFVGSALCCALQVRRLPFVAAVRKKSNEAQIELCNFTGTTRWLDVLEGCDVVIHLAARVHVMNEMAANPLRAFREANVDATMNLAEQAAEMGVKRFVFVSSVKVNGEGTVGHPFRSDDVPKPSDPYGISKMEAEARLLELGRRSGMEVTIVRPPLVYGPGVGANFLRLMELVKLNLPLPFRSIRNRRSMVAMDNLIDLLILCANHPQAAGQIFMVSDGRDISTSELISLIARSMDKRAMLFPVPVILLSILARLLGKSLVVGRLFGSLQVDIEKTKSLLGWQPVISVDAAVKKTVADFLSKFD
jgi:nucleoside-diphosphate-sugar epimerase